MRARHGTGLSLEDEDEDELGMTSFHCGVLMTDRSSHASARNAEGIAKGNTNPSPAHALWRGLGVGTRGLGRDCGLDSGRVDGLEIGRALGDC